MGAYSVRRWPSSWGVWEQALRQGAGTVTGSLNIDTQSQGRANCSAVGFWNLTVYTQWYNLYWLGLLLWQKKNQSPLREAEARNQIRLWTWRQGWTGCGVFLTGLLSMAHLAGFCIAHRITSLGMLKAIFCWALQNLSLIMKMSCDLAYSLILLKHFLN